MVHQFAYFSLLLAMTIQQFLYFKFLHQAFHRDGLSLLERSLLLWRNFQSVSYSGRDLIWRKELYRFVDTNMKSANIITLYRLEKMILHPFLQELLSAVLYIHLPPSMHIITTSERVVRLQLSNLLFFPFWEDQRLLVREYFLVLQRFT